MPNHCRRVEATPSCHRSRRRQLDSIAPRPSLQPASLGLRQARQQLSGFLLVGPALSPISLHWAEFPDGPRSTATSPSTMPTPSPSDGKADPDTIIAAAARGHQTSAAVLSSTMSMIAQCRHSSASCSDRLGTSPLGITVTFANSLRACHHTPLISQLDLPWRARKVRRMSYVREVLQPGDVVAP